MDDPKAEEWANRRRAGQRIVPGDSRDARSQGRTRRRRLRVGRAVEFHHHCAPKNANARARGNLPPFMSTSDPVYVTSGLVRLTRPQLIGTLTGLLLAALLAAIDQTIVGTAEPRIIASLSGFDRYPWVATAYLLTSTVSVPIFASLSDIYGRKPFFLLGATLFVVDLGAVRRGRRAHVPADRRHGTADSVPRPAGHRRRHGDRAALHDRRRHLLADRARPLSGAVRGASGASRRSSVRRSAAGSPTTGRGAPAST